MLYSTEDSNDVARLSIASEMPRGLNEAIVVYIAGLTVSVIRLAAVCFRDEFSDKVHKSIACSLG